jgi:DnaJ-class molecular chaperone
MMNMAKPKTVEAETPPAAKACGDCGGAGKVPGDRYTTTITCSTCDGSGRAPEPTPTPAPAAEAA